MKMRRKGWRSGDFVGWGWDGCPGSSPQTQRQGGGGNLQQESPGLGKGLVAIRGIPVTAAYGRDV